MPLRQRTQTLRASGTNLVTSRTDALGQTTTYTRDPSSNLLLATTDPL
jgi:YD repeat-containing protein